MGLGFLLHETGQALIEAQSGNLSTLDPNDQEVYRQRDSLKKKGDTFFTPYTLWSIICIKAYLATKQTNPAFNITDKGKLAHH